MEIGGDIDTLGREHGLALVVAYGSRARGSHHAGSDLDVGVLRADLRRLAWGELKALHAALSDRVSASELDLADLATDDAICRREVARDGVVLFEDRPGRWVDFVARALIDYADIAEQIEACEEGVKRAALR